MPRPDVTIIIPTRERAATFVHCLRTVTDQSYPSLEILVSDNASNDATHARVAENADPRIRYLNPGKRLNMTANWEFALSHARGEWVGFVGDDDGMLPGGVEAMLGLAGRVRTQLVRCHPCDYLWPQLTGTADGRLVVPTGREETIVDGREALAKLMTGDVHYTRLPTVYSGGFVHSELIIAGRGPDGRFFRSRIPDIYSAIRLTALGRLFIFSETPYAINGISAMSTGISQFSKIKTEQTLAASRQFTSEVNLPMHPSVPALDDDEIPRSIHALLYESYQHVLAIEPSLPTLDPVSQLAIMVRSAGPHAAEMRVWAPLFAARHGITLPPASPLSGLRDTASRWQSRLKLDRIVVSNTAAPVVTNVHEASQVAGRILADPTSSKASIVANLTRFAGSMVVQRLRSSM